MPDKSSDENLFREKIPPLQEQAIENNERIIIIKKGYSRPKLEDSSLGKPHKGHHQKRLKDEGVFYVEPKKRVSYTLTPTARAEIQKLSKHLEISESEAIERFGRSWIPEAIIQGDLLFDKSDRLD